MAMTKTTAALMAGKKAPVDKPDKPSSKVQREIEVKDQRSINKAPKIRKKEAIQVIQDPEESSDDDTPLIYLRRRRAQQKSAHLPTPMASKEKMESGDEDESDDNVGFSPMPDFTIARRALEESQRALEALAKCEDETAKHLNQKEDKIKELQVVHREDFHKCNRLGEELEAAKSKNTLEEIGNENARLKIYNEILKTDSDAIKKERDLLMFVGGNTFGRIEGYIKKSNSEMKALREKLAGQAAELFARHLMAGGLKKDTEEIVEAMVAQHAAMHTTETEQGFNKRKIDRLTEGVATDANTSSGKKRKTMADK
ncbi:hypothetical protein IFR05_001074 [Cadophora sp. M221]|nr:hypothetical protein IFR05_001074 [Cadophora sp. M221]